MKKSILFLLLVFLAPVDVRASRNPAPHEPPVIVVDTHDLYPERPWWRRWFFPCLP